LNANRSDVASGELVRIPFGRREVRGHAINVPVIADAPRTRVRR
jgi:hypothetical protein